MLGGLLHFSLFLRKWHRLFTKGKIAATPLALVLAWCLEVNENVMQIQEKMSFRCHWEQENSDGENMPSMLADCLKEQVSITHTKSYTVLEIFCRWRFSPKFAGVNIYYAGDRQRCSNRLNLSSRHRALHILFSPSLFPKTRDIIIPWKSK